MVERGDLSFAWGVVVVKVEAGFTDSDDPGMSRKRSDRLEHRVVDEPGIMGMNADDGVAIGLALGDRSGTPIGLEGTARCRDDHRRDSARARPGQYGIAIDVVLGLADVTMRVDERNHFRGSMRGKSAAGGFTRWPAGKARPQAGVGPPSALGGEREQVGDPRRRLGEERRGEAGGAHAAPRRGVARIVPTRGISAGCLASVKGAVSAMYLLARSVARSSASSARLKHQVRHVLVDLALRRGERLLERSVDRLGASRRRALAPWK